MARALLSMVVGQINVKCVASLKAKNDPPVGTHDDGPKAFKIANESVKTESRNVHVFDCYRRIQKTENIIDPLDMLWADAFAITIFEEAFKALVAEADDHWPSVAETAGNMSRYMCQRRLFSAVTHNLKWQSACLKIKA
jgi:hypothetical protein